MSPSCRRRDIVLLGKVWDQAVVVARIDPQQRRVAGRADELGQIGRGLVDVEVGRVAAVADAQGAAPFGRLGRCPPRRRDSGGNSNPGGLEGIAPAYGLQFDGRLVFIANSP